MKLAGVKFDNVVFDSAHQVKEAVVTPDRIALDWIESGAKYHLVAYSKDGGTYHGTYGMFRPEDDWIVKITRYTAVDASVVLFCDWHEKDTGRAGSWLCKLEPRKTDG